MSPSPSNDSIRLTRAHVVRHTPSSAHALGSEAALVDIAQDLLLRELSDVGLMADLVFKGGTSLRKLYAGSAGRFSLDLDFSVRDVGTRAEEVLDLLQEHVEGLRLRPFLYGIATCRGKRHLLMSSDALGAPESLSSKLDVSSPPWLEPVERGWVPLPVHAAYGAPLPQLPCGCAASRERRMRKLSVLPRTCNQPAFYRSRLASVALCPSISSQQVYTFHEVRGAWGATETAQWVIGQ